MQNKTMLVNSQTEPPVLFHVASQKKSFRHAEKLCFSNFYWIELFSMPKKSFQTPHEMIQCLKTSIVYLFVCHVQFPAQGAGLLLQFPNVQDKRALYKGAASRNFVLGSPP